MTRTKPAGQRFFVARRKLNFNEKNVEDLEFAEEKRFEV
jgi:hypothetical protein